MRVLPGTARRFRTIRLLGNIAEQRWETTVAHGVRTPFEESNRRRQSRADLNWRFPKIEFSVTSRAGRHGDHLVADSLSGAGEDDKPRSRSQHN